MILAVELYDTLIGTLTGDTRGFDFAPTSDGLERFGANSPVLSVAIPLVPAPRRDHAARRRNWFTELLPEGDQYSYMLAQGDLRSGDTLGFLARYGRDVAGALQLWDVDDPTEPKIPSLRPVTPAQIRSLLEDPITSPLANDPTSGKSSLGGVQPKVVLVRTSHGWAQGLDGYPTTHIVKPQLAGDRATMIFDEEYGSRLARRMGLTDTNTSIENFAGLAALVIERYDRVDGQRVHQEDFSQVLGASGNQKYQRFGGVVSLRRIADVLKSRASETDLVRLARMVVLAVAIGNLDMHTKNLSSLHTADGGVRLAPSYDMVPQVHQPSDGELALAVNGVYRLRDITKDDLMTEFASWGMHRAPVIVTETLDELEAVVSSDIPLDGAFPSLHRDITGFVRNLEEGRPLGATS